jgi:hypothetical protein
LLNGLRGVSHGGFPPSFNLRGTRTMTDISNEETEKQNIKELTKDLSTCIYKWAALRNMPAAPLANIVLNASILMSSEYLGKVAALFELPFENIDLDGIFETITKVSKEFYDQELEDKKKQKESKIVQ